MANEISLRLDQIKKDLNDQTIAKESYKFFKSRTPIRSGNARTHTFLDKNVIEADYPYAVRLNEGWSKQAPDGMVKPTIAFVLDYIKRNAK
jgi:hypothetical protein